MSRTGLQKAIARGEYEVDPDRVALAMIARARQLRATRRSACSEVLVAADRIEIRRAACEADAFPVERTA
jgi:hypothetical protein